MVETITFPERLEIPREVERIAHRLEEAGHETWCVGGAIRDNLLGVPNHDFDLATAAPPETVRGLFKRTVPVGIEHGTVAVLDAQGKPSVRYDQIRIWPTSSTTFGPGRLVQIVGDFGYVVDGLPPDEVRLASLILASRWWKRHEMPMTRLVIPDMGSMEAVSKDDPDVNMLLSQYARTGASWVLV